MLHHPVTVEQEAKSRLARHRWVFILEGKCLILQRYMHEMRSKKTEAYKVVQFYERGSEGGYGDWQWLTKEEVPWDADLQGDALAELVKNIVVTRDS